MLESGVEGPDGAPLERTDFGWYMGWVASQCSEAVKRRNPGVTYDVWYCNNETNGVLPASLGVRGKDAAARVPCGLTAETWGVEAKWVELCPPEGRERCPHPKKAAKGGTKKKAKAK